MKYQRISQESEIKKLQTGVNKMAMAVGSTLGAKGRNVIIDNDYASPTITKDGVTVARSIMLEDTLENMGARLIKDVAHKTNEEAGDGTTTATVLAASILNSGIRYVDSGSNPIFLKRGIDKAVSKVVEKLKSISVSCSDINTVTKVANVSANNDEEIGKSISFAIDKASKDGVITIQEATGSDTQVDITKGMKFDKGYMSPYFVTDNSRMEVVFDDPYILFVNKRVSLVRELLRPMEVALKNNKPLLIIADDIDIEAMKVLVINKVQNTLQVAAVKSPSYGAMRKDIMQDIAILTGGFVYEDNTGFNLDDVTSDTLGSAEKVIITANDTIIINGKGDKSELEDRIKLINEHIEMAPSSYDAEKLRERKAKLVGGVVVIHVGGRSDVEMRERKDRFEDALNATQAAIQEGIVPGGGVALLRCIDCLNELNVENEDEKLGVKIVAKAIEAPFRVIMKNAGLPDDVILNNLMQAPVSVYDTGYNVYNDKYEMFFETGIIDPVKVTRVALENAASIAGLLLTTSYAIYNVGEDGKDL